MLSPDQILTLVTATGAAIDIFDKISGQIKSVILKTPKEKESTEDRWRRKVFGERDKITVRQDQKIIQTITAADLARLSPDDLSLIRTYEKKMNQYYRSWQRAYNKRELSPDPLVNAEAEKELVQLISKMKNELTGIIDFLQRIGLYLDDHYMHVRHLVETESGM